MLGSRLSAEQILKDVEQRIKSVEEELNVSGAIVVAEGRPSCSECMKIEVDTIEDFQKVLAALVRQGIAMGTLPILVLVRKTSNSIAVYGVDMCNQVIASLELELRY